MSYEAGFEESGRRPDPNFTPAQMQALRQSAETLRILQSLTGTVSSNENPSDYATRFIETNGKILEVDAETKLADSETLQTFKEHERAGLPQAYNDLLVCYAGAVEINDVKDDSNVTAYEFWRIDDPVSTFRGGVILVKQLLRHWDEEELIKPESKELLRSQMEEAIVREEDPEKAVAMRLAMQDLLKRDTVIRACYEEIGDMLIQSAIEAEELAHLLAAAELFAAKDLRTLKEQPLSVKLGE